MLFVNSLQNITMKKLGVLLLVIVALASCRDANNKIENIRVATFNVALYRQFAGDLTKDLTSGSDEQIKIIAEIIQRQRPDILVLQEFDYDSTEQNIKLLQDNYFAQSQNGAQTINYPYAMSFASNTGLLTEFDLNNDGKKGTPSDCYGYGAYPGQYAFAVFSKFPLQHEQLVSFQKFLWKDMPDAVLPVNEKGEAYYSMEELKDFRLSSKNHVDIPVTVNNKEIHLLIAHPTPPVFDGPEDRNGKRNHDEIRLLADYIHPDKGNYLYDDKGQPASLDSTDSFIVFGDMNAAPKAGDSYDNAILQLLRHPKVNYTVTFGNWAPASEGSREVHQQKPNEGHPARNTSMFGLRIDYVLPSRDLKVRESGVFWPASADSLSYLTIADKGSDHRMVWMDVKID